MSLKYWGASVLSIDWNRVECIFLQGADFQQLYISGMYVYEYEIESIEIEIEMPPLQSVRTYVHDHITNQSHSRLLER